MAEQLSDNPIKVTKQKLPPTMKLIDFQKKRFKNKTELAKKLTPQRSFERLLVYCNKPKFNLETSLKQLEKINNEESQSNVRKRSLSGKRKSSKKETLENQVEKSLAKAESCMPARS